MKTWTLLGIVVPALAVLSACTTTRNSPPKPSAAKVEQSPRSTEETHRESGLGVTKIHLRSKRGEPVADF